MGSWSRVGDDEHIGRRYNGWLNIAENELSSLTRQCVAGRRFGDTEALRQETSAWSNDVNGRQRGVDWHMRIDDARLKLASVYPNLEQRRWIYAGLSVRGWVLFGLWQDVIVRLLSPYFRRRSTVHLTTNMIAVSRFFRQTWYFDRTQVEITFVLDVHPSFGVAAGESTAEEFIVAGHFLQIYPLLVVPVWRGFNSAFSLCRAAGRAAISGHVQVDR